MLASVEANVSITKQPPFWLQTYLLAWSINLPMEMVVCSASISYKGNSGQ